MDQLIEVLEQHEDVQFLVSLDYSTNEADLYSCNEWANLYTELGEFDNNPLILDGDPDHAFLENQNNVFLNIFGKCSKTTDDGSTTCSTETHYPHATNM